MISIFVSCLFYIYVVALRVVVICFTPEHFLKNHIERLLSIIWHPCLSQVAFMEHYFPFSHFVTIFPLEVIFPLQSLEVIFPLWPYFCILTNLYALDIWIACLSWSFDNSKYAFSFAFTIRQQGLIFRLPHERILHSYVTWTADASTEQFVFLKICLFLICHDSIGINLPFSVERIVINCDW